MSTNCETHRREYVVKSISIPRRDLPKLMRAAKRERRSFSSYVVACALAECKSRELDNLQRPAAA